MVSDPIAQGLLSALFVGTGLLFAGRALRPGTWVDRVGDVVHLLMSGSMLAMTWPVTSTWLPAAPQAAVFALAATWFAVLAVLPRGRPPRHDDHAGQARWLPWFHLVMSAAMVWMLLAMPVGASMGASMGTAVDAAMTAGVPAHQGGHQHEVQGWLPVSLGMVLLVLLVAGTALAVSTATWTRRSPAGRRRLGLGWDVGHVAMGVGMVAMAGPVLLR